MNEEYEAIKTMLLNGYSIDYRLISLSIIYDDYAYKQGYAFQVHCTNGKGFKDNDPHKGSYLFESLREAITKFLKMKELCYGTSNFS